MAKKYIDAEQLKQTVETSMDMQDLYLPSHFFDVIDGIPAADVVEVCRCKDCKYGDTGTDEDGRQFYKCIGIHYGGVSPTDYCNYGERKDG
jgi:hypothetical protein